MSSGFDKRLDTIANAITKHSDVQEVDMTLRGPQFYIDFEKLDNNKFSFFWYASVP